MQNALIYTRVSTDEQANKGFSLPHQKNVLKLYCQHKGINILRHYKEDFSAKNFNRPAFNELFSYVKANRKSIDFLLFTRWDRFSRNQEEAYRVIREFRNLGIEVNAIEQPLDLSQPDSKVMLAVYLVIPEVENDKNSIRTKEGLRRAMKEGCFVGIAPFGYKNVRNEEGKSTLAIKSDLAPIIRRAFTDYAKGVLSSEEIRKKYYHRGLKFTKQSMLNLLKNPVYCGKIAIKEWKKEDAVIVQGLHPSIIDDKTFNTVQRVFADKVKKPIHKFSEIDEYLPLRGFLQCAKCGRALTGSASRGRNGVRHFYYHCQPKCKERFRAEDANAIFENLLKEFVVKEDALILYKQILNETFLGEQKDRKLRLRQIKKEITNLRTRMESIENKFFDDLIDANTFNAMKGKTQLKINDLQAESESLNSIDKNIDKYLKLGISFLHGIDKLYKSSPANIKKKIVGSIFPEKLIFLKNKYRTAFLNELFALILSKHKPFRLLEIKTPRQNDGESKKAPFCGFTFDTYNHM
ncbi:Site-specific DNA recombinase [Lutibacter oricola]|uniref:Site-specific DNA recombinase n=1 Tax=Lutibacter oricola TaxID=762486 RepID=A0A1H2WKX4_9FLAO|nr:recombinase family protein [Lutibacter oricola]SDW81211.1 Site-specific DNA recombinase [Lutibacter oricola]